MRVLIISEDHVKDEKSLKVLIRSFFKKSDKVEVCRNPRIRGVWQALNFQILDRIFIQYQMVDLFILLVDRDGDNTRKSIIENLEKKALSCAVILFGENFHQELETICLAGVKKLPKSWKWESVRNEPQVKEKYFYPYVKGKDIDYFSDQGREFLMIESTKNIQRLFKRCPELKNLSERVKHHVSKCKIR